MGRSTFILWRVPEEPRPWYRIIFWWELRRIPYNLFVGLAGLTCLPIFAFYGALSVPMIFWIIAYGLGANACYTAGWVVEVFVTHLLRKNWPGFGAVAFMGGLILSVTVTLLPALLILVFALAGFENPSPYAHMTSVRPQESDLAGKYVMTRSSLAWKYHIDLSTTTAPTIELREDGTLTYRDLTVCPTGILVVDDFYSPEVFPTEGTGRWELSSNSDDHWGVLIHFDTPRGDVGDGKPDIRFMTNYYVLNDGPPYGFYEVLGDPDSFEGNWFERAD